MTPVNSMLRNRLMSKLSINPFTLLRKSGLSPSPKIHTNIQFTTLRHFPQAQHNRNWVIILNFTGELRRTSDKFNSITVWQTARIQSLYALHSVNYFIITFIIISYEILIYLFSRRKGGCFHCFKSFFSSIIFSNVKDFSNENEN